MRPFRRYARKLVLDVRSAVVDIDAPGPALARQLDRPLFAAES